MGEGSGVGGPPLPPPFLFRPARLRFPAHQHPFFEDGDVHRHLALQPPPLPEEEEEEEEEEDQCHFNPHRRRNRQAPAHLEEEDDEEEATTMEAWAGLASDMEACAGAGSQPPPRLLHHLLQLREAACSSCQHTFPSAHLLDLHLLECHDSLFRIMAQKQPMYQCLVESCPERFKGAEDRKEHLVSVHRYPPDFHFNMLLECKSSRAKAKEPLPRERSVPMELNAEDLREVLEHEEVAMDLGLMEGNGEGNEWQTQTEPTLTWVSQEEPLKPPSQSRIPATICFGQGATRSFGGRRKKP